MTDIKDAVVLVTGANGGLGREFVGQALAHGATRVYATARAPKAWDDPRVVPLVLDVTDPASAARAAEVASDVTVLVNNAGAANGSSLLHPDLSAVRALFETNFWGQLEVTNAFGPVLERNGGGAVLNVLSVLSWLAVGDAYSATKAALWSATNTQRLALAGQGTQVVALHVGYTDTPMTTGIDADKNDPADVVAAAYAGLVAGDHEVLADELSRQVKGGLAAPIAVLYPQLG
ncbi:SDR family oxidoreductase [Nocardioides antri]|uniref:SDR family oxidoreductase n=1 Tax=Nocardioides antri TaxID=2607659 RepID=A0A5B1LUC2_9ACTN|nr:SDR family oxidoreductase [Nocardioides antri]KAA1424231.1 SDR family oxidoreductase [Nocardioides antri]